MINLTDKLPINANFCLLAIDKTTNRIVGKRTKHNVFTNIGRKWLRNTSGASAYLAEGECTPFTLEKIRFMSFGIGGVNQTVTAIGETSTLRTQLELPTVKKLEDPIAISYDGEDFTWLKEVEAQSLSNIEDFPDDYKIRFTSLLVQSEISFIENTSLNSGIVVGLSVPISEAGLYLSGANIAADQDDFDNAERMAAYATFTPLYVNSNVDLQAIWELRF